MKKINYILFYTLYFLILNCSIKGQNKDSIKILIKDYESDEVIKNSKISISGGGEKSLFSNSQSEGFFSRKSIDSIFSKEGKVFLNFEKENFYNIHLREISLQTFLTKEEIILYTFPKGGKVTFDNSFIEMVEKFKLRFVKIGKLNVDYFTKNNLILNQPNFENWTTPGLQEFIILPKQEVICDFLTKKGEYHKISLKFYPLQRIKLLYQNQAFTYILIPTSAGLP